MKNSIVLFLVYSLLLMAKGFVAIENTALPGPTASSAEGIKVTANPALVPDKTSSTTVSPTTSSSTTEKPITTSTPDPTPVPTASTTNAPIPTTQVPDPQAGTWTTSDKDNVIIAHMAVQLSITYNVKDANNKTVLIDIPSNNETKASGIFTSNLQTMELSWKSSGLGDNSMSLVFKSNNTTKMYWLSKLEVSIQADDLPDIDSKIPLKVIHEQEHFNTTVGNSYRCQKLQTFNLVKLNDTQVIGHIKVTDLQFQAFKTGHDTSFGVAEDCAFETPDIVPIAVGCVLAGLVVIILVGYLITRRRQGRGYLSM